MMNMSDITKRNYKAEKQFACTILGATVSSKVASEFAEICKPHSTHDIIEAFIISVVNGDLKINHEAGESK